MRSRRNIIVAATLAVALAIQMSVPVAAVAIVSMRCAGLPATATPCATVVVRGDESRTAAERMTSACACCRAMPANCPMHAGMIHHAALSHHCIVSVTRMAADPAVRASVRSRWMLVAAPALAPPTVPVSVPETAPVNITPRFQSPPLPLPDLTGSHGLRAPPTI